MADKVPDASRLILGDTNWDAMYSKIEDDLIKHYGRNVAIDISELEGKGWLTNSTLLPHSDLRKLFLLAYKYDRRLWDRIRFIALSRQPDDSSSSSEDEAEK